MQEKPPVTASEVPWGYTADPTMEVYEQDKSPIDTGLLGPTGKPIYRYPEWVPFGFPR